MSARRQTPTENPEKQEISSKLDKTLKTPTTGGRRSPEPSVRSVKSPLKSARQDPRSPAKTPAKSVRLSVQTKDKSGKTITAKGGDSSSDEYSEDSEEDYSEENYSDDDAKGQISAKSSGKVSGKDSESSKGKDGSKEGDGEIIKKRTKKEEKTLEAQLVEAFTLVERQFYAGKERAEVRLEREKRKQDLTLTQQLNTQRIEYYDHAVRKAGQVKGRSREDEGDGKGLRDSGGKMTLPFPIAVLQKEGYGHGKVVLKCDATGKECVATFGKDGAIEVDHKVKLFMESRRKLLNKLEITAKEKRAVQMAKELARAGAGKTYHKLYKQTAGPLDRHRKDFARNGRYQEGFDELDEVEHSVDGEDDIDPTNINDRFTMRQKRGRVAPNLITGAKMAAKLATKKGATGGGTVVRRGGQYRDTTVGASKVVVGVGLASTLPGRHVTIPEYEGLAKEDADEVEGVDGLSSKSTVADASRKGTYGPQLAKAVYDMLVATDLLEEYEEFFYFEQVGVVQLLAMEAGELKALFPRLGSRSRVQRFLADERKKLEKLKLWQHRDSKTDRVNQHQSKNYLDNDDEHEEKLVPDGFTVGFTASRCEHHTTVEIRKKGEYLTFRNQEEFYRAKRAEAAKAELKRLEKSDKEARRRGSTHHGAWVDEAPVQRVLVDDYWKHLTKQEKLRRDKGMYSKQKAGQVQGATLTAREKQQLKELEVMEYTAKPDSDLVLALKPIVSEQRNLHWTKNVVAMDDVGGRGIPHTYDQNHYKYVHEEVAQRQQGREREDTHTRSERRIGHEAHKDWDLLQEPIMTEGERRAIAELQGEEFIPAEDRGARRNMHWGRGDADNFSSEVSVAPDGVHKNVADHGYDSDGSVQSADSEWSI